MIDVLQPFEVTDSNTTCVTQNVGKELHSLSEKDLFSLDGGWTICSLNNQLALESVGVVSVD